MPQHHRGDHGARVYRPGQPEDRRDPVLDVRGFASRYVLLGIDGSRVRVRRKIDGSVGTLAYRVRPLLFRDFRPAPGGQRP